jgi:hypothetical protein
MSGKSIVPGYQIISNQSMSADSDSMEVDVRYASHIYVQLDFTGAPFGTFAVMVRNDTTPNFVSLSGLSQTPTCSGSAGSVGVNIANIGFTKMRIHYTFSSGSGTLNGYVSTKGF